MAMIFWKLGETVNTIRYCQRMINLSPALIEKRPELATRHIKVILQDGILPHHIQRKRSDTPFMHLAGNSCPIRLLFDYLISSMAHTLFMIHNNYEDDQK
ncbi:hypothetical protein CEXT_501191 [Caerostris extrusa]|uniref:Uncharacterized protein n=1 Tax=Caerostris extrusa TaxID=172846 RepID=A0AAV4RZ17_CAEEX|nr:hypothetical protein CEXT_501191 [Caerostris extrusa]